MQLESTFKKGDKIGRRYLVHHALMGGMGEVYLCQDLERNVRVALKTISARFLSNPKMWERFDREVATWIALGKHPNIVQCLHLDKWLVSSHPLLFLEWVVGEEGIGTDLRSWVKRCGPLEPRLALQFAIDVCRGLNHANQKIPGFVHCDVKPENVLVSQGLVAKVTDFGIARFLRQVNLPMPGNSWNSGGRLHTTSAGGTPPYMAPEQWRNSDLDARVDVYAVGCLLFELLTGRLAFGGQTGEECRNMHLGSPPPQLTDLKGLDGLLNPILQRCLAKQRDRRYSSLGALLKELSQVYQKYWQQQPRADLVAEGLTAVDYNNRGYTYRNLNKYDQALANFNEAIRLLPTLAVAYLNRGVVYKQTGEYAKGLADINEGIRLDPNNPEGYLARGGFYHSRGRVSQALSDYADAIRLDPNRAPAYYERGCVHLEQREYTKAESDFTHAIVLSPSEAYYYLARGLNYAKMGEKTKAQLDCEKALRLNPNLIGQMKESLPEVLRHLGSLS